MDVSCLTCGDDSCPPLGPRVNQLASSSATELRDSNVCVHCVLNTRLARDAVCTQSVRTEAFSRVVLAHGRCVSRHPTSGLAFSSWSGDYIGQRATHSSRGPARNAS